jgi:hypothetical protein
MGFADATLLPLSDYLRERSPARQLRNHDHDLNASGPDPSRGDAFGNRSRETNNNHDRYPRGDDQ